jgi:hypothetical protein
MQIFEFDSHFAYLQERLRGKGEHRGIKTRFARELQIQPSYLSQVLRRHFALSLEQADLANRFFHHSPEEAEFFFLLVSHDRAGSVSLKKHFRQQMKRILDLRLQTVERLGRRAEVSDEAKGVFYSSWLYPAVHVSCTIPRLRTREAIATELRVPEETVGKVLDFLEANGIVERKSGEFLPTKNWIRLEQGSPHYVKLHANWRLKAIQNLETQTDRDLHFSGIYSMDARTAARIKDRFLEFLKEQQKEIEPAKEEELFVIGIDFFRP